MNDVVVVLHPSEKCERTNDSRHTIWMMPVATLFGFDLTAIPENKEIRRKTQSHTVCFRFGVYLTFRNYYRSRHKWKYSLKLRHTIFITDDVNSIEKSTSTKFTGLVESTVDFELIKTKSLTDQRGRKAFENESTATRARVAQWTLFWYRRAAQFMRCVEFVLYLKHVMCFFPAFAVPASLHRSIESLVCHWKKVKASIQVRLVKEDDSSMSGNSREKKSILWCNDDFSSFFRRN